VISSAVVASMVTSYLKERSDLRKKKLEIYTNYLQQFYKIFPGLGLQWTIGKTDQEFQHWKAIHEKDIRELETRLLCFGRAEVYFISPGLVVAWRTSSQRYLLLAARVGDARAHRGSRLA
jgi:hypothetical protein